MLPPSDGKLANESSAYDLADSSVDDPTDDLSGFLLVTFELRDSGDLFASLEIDDLELLDPVELLLVLDLDETFADLYFYRSRTNHYKL